MNFDKYTIVVVGLGYVGLPLAVEFGKKRKTIGFDIDATRIAELTEYLDRTLEVSEQEIRESIHLCLISDINLISTIQGSQNTVFIITVPTPVDRASRPDFSNLLNASKIVGEHLRANDLVVYESTVYPGATEEVCVPVLESTSGLSYISDSFRSMPDRYELLPALSHVRRENGFFCAYSPERINPGDKEHRLTGIKKITSGSTAEVASGVDKLYREIITAGTYKVSSIKVAEAAKVIENAQRDINIAFVNELSIIFNLMNIDTQQVLEAAATKWNFIKFRPGLVGGHCIGVDPYYLTSKSQELGYQPEIILSGRRINDGMGSYCALEVIRLMSKCGIKIAGSTVGILGVTFKENCPDVRNTKVVDIVRELESWNITVKVLDPLANPGDLKREYGISVIESIEGLTADSLIVAVAHSSYVRLTPAQLRTICRNQQRPVIGDLKAIYDPVLLGDQGFEVFRL